MQTTCSVYREMRARKRAFYTTLFSVLHNSSCNVLFLNEPTTVRWRTHIHHIITNRETHTGSVPAIYIRMYHSTTLCLLSDYGTSLGRAIPIVLHWIFGTLVVLIGWWQFVPHMTASSGMHTTLYQHNSDASSLRRTLHRWNGRLFCACVLVTAAMGLAYMIVNRGAATVLLTVCFSVYGLGMSVLVVNAWVRARRIRWAVQPSLTTSLTLISANEDVTRHARVDEHHDAGHRLFWFMMAAPVFHACTLPVVLWMRLHRDGSSVVCAAMDTASAPITTYIHVCAVLMFLPYVVCECWLFRQRQQRTLRQEVYRYIYDYDYDQQQQQQQHPHYNEHANTKAQPDPTTHIICNITNSS